MSESGHGFPTIKINVINSLSMIHERIPWRDKSYKTILYLLTSCTATLVFFFFLIKLIHKSRIFYMDVQSTSMQSH